MNTLLYELEVSILLESVSLVTALIVIAALYSKVQLLEQIAAIVRSSGDSVMVIDRTNRITWINDAFCRNTGYSLEESLRQSPSDLFECPESSEETAAEIRAALDAGKPIRREVLIRTKDNSREWVELDLVPILNQRGIAVAYTSIQRSITERKRLEQELAESRSLLNGAVDATRLDIAILNAAGTILFVSGSNNGTHSHAKVLSSEYKVGQNYFDCVNAEHLIDRKAAETISTSICSVIDGARRHIAFEYSVTCEGGHQWYAVTVNRFTTDCEIRVVVTRDNISEQKAYEQRLLNKQEKLRSIYQASSDGILLLNEGRIFDCNEKLLKLLGATGTEQMQGKHLFQLAPETQPSGESSQSILSDVLHRANETGEVRLELTLCRSNASDFPAECTFTKFLHDGKQVTLATFRDISERKLAESKLQELNQKLQQDLAAHAEAERQIRETSAYLDVYRKILDHHAIVAETDTKGNIVSVNQAFCRISGYSREELLGKNHRILNSGEHSTELWRGMYRTVSRGGIWHGEICNRAKDGKLYWVDTTIAPLYNDACKIRGYFAIRADVTNLKEAQKQAEKANRSKSEFLANMSHEIRTPMTAILGYSDLLSELVTCDKCSVSPSLQSAIDTIRRNCEHLMAIINDILDISKIEAEKMTVESVPVNIAQLVDDVLKTLQVKSQEKGLNLSCRWLTEFNKPIYSDPTRLRQILVNLIGNAIKFTERGKVALEIGWDSRLPSNLCFKVMDTGIGMNSEQQARLFQAFEQADSSMTRRFGGTGLGLRISKKLAQMLGGDIQVKTELGRGSCFTLSISAEGYSTDTAKLFKDSVLEADLNAPPQVAKFASESSLALQPEQVLEAVSIPTSVAAKPELHGLRILLAEDGIDNQRLILHHLKKAGAEVQLVCNGREAVEALTVDGTVDGPLKSPIPFDLILMDMQMPEMDGCVATQTLRSKGANLPILALTAHAMQSDLQLCLDAGCNLRITKPIDRKQLIHVCRTEGFATSRNRFLPEPSPLTLLTDLQHSSTLQSQ